MRKVSQCPRLFCSHSTIAGQHQGTDSNLICLSTGKAAVHKLRLLGKVEEQLARKKLHGEFLDGGLLGKFPLLVRGLVRLDDERSVGSSKANH